MNGTRFDKDGSVGFFIGFLMLTMFLDILYNTGMTLIDIEVNLILSVFGAIIYGLASGHLDGRNGRRKIHVQ